MTASLSRLLEAAARSADIEELSRVALDFLGPDCDTAGVWSRFGSGGWHLHASRGAVPATPPENADGSWQLVTVATEGRTTVLAAEQAALSGEERDLLGGALEAGQCRLDAQAAVEAATYSGDQLVATVLDATPDAVVVVSPAGTVVQANVQASELFGYPLDELIGSQLEQLLPDELRSTHARHRARYVRAPVPRSMGAGQDLFARHRDGSAIPVDIALTPLDVDGEVGVAAFVRDASVRRRGETARQQVREAELARRQASELNDNVIQGLTSSVWLLEVGDEGPALATLRETLAEARKMMADMFGQSESPAGPGELRRTTAPAGSHIPMKPAEPHEPAPEELRVLVVDDTEAIRMIVRSRFELEAGVTVVGEAEDGLAALEAVEELRPDVVLMDLSMPRMDGLEATAVLRERHPDLRIVILTGHAAESMRQQALEVGANAYVEKGTNFDELVAAVLGEPANR